MELSFEEKLSRQERERFQCNFQKGAKCKLEKEQKHFRVGISVSKKLGNAVMRNKIKRRIRHVLLTHQVELAALDFVVISRKGVEILTYQELEQNLLHVLKIAKIYQDGLSSEKEK